MLIGFHFGMFATVYVIMSVVSRRGARREHVRARDRYSLTMSFCVVPWSAAMSAPCSSATT